LLVKAQVFAPGSTQNTNVKTKEEINDSFNLRTSSKL
jgi:hypothetical protein